MTKIHGSTAELEAKLASTSIGSKLRREIEIELAYRQRDQQWAETRARHHKIWLERRK